MTRFFEYEFRFKTEEYVDNKLIVQHTVKNCLPSFVIDSMKEGYFHLNINGNWIFIPRENISMVIAKERK
jgi:hypothetical protein